MQPNSSVLFKIGVSWPRYLTADLPKTARLRDLGLSNDLPLGALPEMTARQIKVPGSIAIVGYDDIGFAAEEVG